MGLPQAIILQHLKLKGLLRDPRRKSSLNRHKPALRGPAASQQIRQSWVKFGTMQLDDMLISQKRSSI
ncbi:hypothetical protein CCL23_25170 [Pseudomonas syringae]|nr:hypothetical protein CCL23_25170 [Pseudomonas syringae]